MNAPESLVLDLVEWISETPRPMDDVMEAWRTSCPRLPVWEDAVDNGYVVHERHPGSVRMVRVTPAGRDFLNTRRRGRLPA